MRRPLLLVSLLVVVGSAGCDSDGPPPALKEYFEKFWSEALDAFRIEAERSWSEKSRPKPSKERK